MRGKVGIFLVLIVTTILFVAAHLNAGTLTGSWYMWGQAAGTLGIMGIVFSGILSARHPFLDRLFGGLDTVYKLHHIIGGVAFILILNHPLLFIVSSLPASTLSYYLLPSPSVPNSLGVIALYTLLLLIFLTLFVDLPYKLWKKTHEWMWVVVLLSSLHFVLVPSSLTAFTPFKIWLIFWAALALIAALYKRFLYYRFSPRASYEIVEIHVAEHIAVVTLRTVDTVPFTVRPGQFVFISFTHAGQDMRDEHPFSVVAVTPDTLVLGYKIVGPFTLTLSQLAPGTRLIVRGSYGTFGERARRATDMVWIAGGIGITPFISMARNLHENQRATLIYVTHGSGTNPLDPYVASLVHDVPQLTIYRHVSTQRGRLTGDVLARALPITPRTYFFLCGPLPMMESITHQLVELGVRRKHIIYEDFAFK